MINKENLTYKIMMKSIYRNSYYYFRNLNRRLENEMSTMHDGKHQRITYQACVHARDVNDAQI